MTYRDFEVFVVSMKATAKRLEELSALMTVTKRIVSLLAKTLAAAVSRIQIEITCSAYSSVRSAFPTGGVVWQ